MSTVLVVDDHPDNRDLVRTLLTYRGHLIVEASNGLEALELARADHPDLVITDVLMPGMDGCELVRALRAEPATATIPVIFYTANYLEDEIRPIAEAYGVSSILQKSTDPEVLLRTVEEVLTQQPQPVQGKPDGRAMQQHLQTVNAKLLSKIRELETKEVELRASEERFRRIAESAPVGLFLGDAAGRAVYVNPRLVELLRCRAGDLLGDGWRDFLGRPGDGTSGAVPGSGTQRWRQALRIDTEERWFDVSLAAVLGVDGRPFATTGTADDVTAAVLAEQRQREMDARAEVTERLEGLGRLAGGVAHDFNNLLTIILAYAKFAQADSIRGLEQGQVDDETGRLLLRHLDRVLGAGNRAANLTSQLLTFGRCDASQPAVLDVNKVLLDISELLGRTLGEHIEIVVELAPALRSVLADPSQLEQIVLNLAVNARDAMPAGGVITLRTANRDSAADALPAELPAGRYVRVAVEDTGCGMPPEVVRRALDPFFTTKPPGEGTGLGLATVYGIVSRTGGHLSIRSAVDQGTSIDVHLPATDQAAAPAAVEDDGEDPAGTESLLVVDDEPAICDIAERILSRAGYRVLVATSGAQAIEVIDAGGHRVDLLLTDVVMPQMFGNELADHVAARQPQTRVLYMSGWADALTEENGTLPPGTTVLAKPFSAAALLRAVRRVLDASRV
ncbi:MAG TPA: response regulator [Mycobacteriales bacterium]|nr:response regulator [Mycobacteriales bacterium]